jgi:hypothetical protein
MSQKIGSHTIDEACTIENAAAKPCAVIGSIHDGDIAIVPSAIEIGVNVLSGCHDDLSCCGAR